jgi:hypothetical protein
MAYQGLLARERGDLELAESYLDKGLHNQIMVKTGGLLSSLLFELADIRRLRGDLKGAELANEEAIAYRTHEGDARVTSAYLRVRAEIASARGGLGGARHADQLFRQSIDTARSRSLLFCELEATIGLARHMAGQGGRKQARRLLESLLTRMSEGHDLPVMREARELIVELSEDQVLRPRSNK